MKKIIFISLATLFFAAYTFYNVQVSSHDGDISLEYIALLAEASSESGGDDYVCSSGGPGSIQCSTGVGGGAQGGSGSFGCSVTCTTGYYSCCNAWHNKCQCRVNQT